MGGREGSPQLSGTPSQPVWAADFSPGPPPPGVSLRVPCQPGGQHDSHQRTTVTQTTQFLDFRVCSSLRLSRPSLFGQMIRKRKKTHFWWQNDPWLTGRTSLCLPGILVLLSLSQGPLRPPCEPCGPFSLIRFWDASQIEPAAHCAPEDTAAGSPAQGFRSEDLGSSTSHVTFGRCLNSSVSALHACHWVMRSVPSPSLGVKTVKERSKLKCAVHVLLLSLRSVTLVTRE